MLGGLFRDWELADQIDKLNKDIVNLCERAKILENKLVEQNIKLIQLEHYLEHYGGVLSIDDQTEGGVSNG